MSQGAEPESTQQEAAEQEKKKVGGRNLPKAIAVGVGIVVIALGSLLWSPWIFALVVALAVTGAAWEIAQAFSTVGIRVTRAPIYTATAISPFVCYAWGLDGQVVLVGALIVAI